MNGIIIVDKPAGFTSFDVVAKMRGICNTRKIGHGGTLDPMATGVLPVFIGRAAKAVDLAPDQSKAYLAEVLFGIATDTGDITGTVLNQTDAVVDEDALLQVLPAFLGEQSQLPPMYSAVKINGKPLYKYAREGKTIDRKPRPITIHQLEYLGGGDNRYKLSVACSKGTYIRTLVEDIGTALGLPATLAALCRTRAGVFPLEEAHSLAEIQQAKQDGTLEKLLLPVERLFAGMPRLTIDEPGLQRLKNGAMLYRVSGTAGQYAVFCNDEFAGLAALDEAGNLRANKLFCE